ncbi:semaphorin 5c-like [Crassostrea virginica]
MATLLLPLFALSLVCLSGVKGSCNIHSGVEYYTCTRYSKVSYSEPYKCGFWYWQRCYKTRYTTGSHHSTCTRNCRVNGAWSSWQTWGGWGSCDKTCGRGNKIRYSVRQCNNPIPKNGGSNCHGSHTRREIHACSIRPCAVNGGWSSWQTWGKWGSCDKSCGRGSKVRYSVRQCNNPKPQHGGQDCIGSHRKKDSKACFLKTCVVDGGWGDFGPWGKFSECTQTCGGGAMSRYRYRECDKPKPQGGGRFCSGDSVESDTERCNVISCEDSSNVNGTVVENTGNTAPTNTTDDVITTTSTPSETTAGNGT